MIWASPCFGVPSVLKSLVFWVSPSNMATLFLILTFGQYSGFYFFTINNQTFLVPFTLQLSLRVSLRFTEVFVLIIEVAFTRIFQVNRNHLYSLQLKLIRESYTT